MIIPPDAEVRGTGAAPEVLVAVLSAVDLPSDAVGGILTLILALTGGAGLVGIITAIRGWRTDRWTNDGTLVQRLNEDSKQQGLRADREERARRAWEDQAGRYRRQLVPLLPPGMDPDDTVWLTGTHSITAPPPGLTPPGETP